MKDDSPSFRWRDEDGAFKGGTCIGETHDRSWMSEQHVPWSDGWWIPSSILLLHGPETDVAIIASSHNRLLIWSHKYGWDAVSWRFISPQGDGDYELVRYSHSHLNSDLHSGLHSGLFPLVMARLRIGHKFWLDLCDVNTTLSRMCTLHSGNRPTDFTLDFIWNSTQIRNFDGICIKVSKILWKMLFGH